MARLVADLLEHLRHLMLVQHMGEVPDTLPVTEETRGRLREQANQLGAPTVVRLIDLLHVATEDIRQGGDPRLPLELALVKVTRPGSDLSRESLAFRVDQLEQGRGATAASNKLIQAGPAAAAAPTASAVETPPSAPEAAEAPAAEPPSLELEQLQEAWRRTILPAVEHRSIPAAAMLAEAHPSALDGVTLTLEFPPTASFMSTQAEDPKNSALLQDALYEVTGRRLELAFAVGDERTETIVEDEHPATEEEILELMKSTFDARELEA
jgi:DNA polymerase III gamma/tau subunit